MKNKFAITIPTFTLIVFLAFSCLAPGTKESYLQGFEKFIDRVKMNYRDYSNNDWKWADSKFEKYASEWYKDFRNELSEVEKLKVAGWIVEYESLRGRDKFRDLFNKFIKEDVGNARKDVEKYFKKDFDSDLSEAVEGAKEIGDSALKVLGDIARELKKKRKDGN